MKAVLLDLKSGKPLVDEVPPPALKPDGVLVRVRRSLISLGTERGIIKLANLGPLGKAKDRPDLARKVLNKARQEGWWQTYKVVRNLLHSPIPLGYSCSGEVLQVGERGGELEPGQRVACAGLGFANHAEVVYVPRNLVHPLPAGLDFEAGAFVTVGAIALQGVRLGKLEIGDRVVVTGLGLVGQLAVQLARAAGASVLASDLDPAKMALAKELGADAVAPVGELVPAVEDFTGGHGADCVLVCAASKTRGPLESAARAARLRGRVVVVGDVLIEADRRLLYEKELDLVVSRSYGPGRHDPAYELRGQDYPHAFVRWTEGRNMQAFLDLVAAGRVEVERLVTHRYAIEDALDAYDVVTGKVSADPPPIAMMLELEGRGPVAPTVRLEPARRSPARSGLRLGLIGAGQFAKGVLVPAFAADPRVSIGAVCTGTGITAKKVAESYGAAVCTSDPMEVVGSDAIDAVLITTRHDQHAPLTAAALRAGKAVFVEKPLALDEAGLREVLEAAEAPDAGGLFVGFNRRFAPHAVRCRAFFDDGATPVIIHYRVNAGKLPPDSWVHDPVEGGGRIRGEVCHFVDLVSFVAGSPPRRVHAEGLARAGSTQPEPDDLAITLRLENGSIAVIHYFASGDPSLPKETFEVHGGGRSAVCDNYRTLHLHQGNKVRRRKLLNQAKGHREEVTAFIDAAVSGGPWPIPVGDLVRTTMCTFLVHESLETGRAVDLRPPARHPAEVVDSGE